MDHMEKLKVAFEDEQLMHKEWVKLTENNLPSRSWWDRSPMLAFVICDSSLAYTEHNIEEFGVYILATR